MASSSSSSSSRFNSCFLSWISQQQSDLNELLPAIPNTPNDTSTSDDALRSLVSKIMRHIEDYTAQRLAFVREDPPAFFCPGWCSSFENCFLWIGGCRPTLSSRLVYAQSGTELEAHVRGFLAGGVQAGGLIELTDLKMARIDDPHQRTLRGCARGGVQGGSDGAEKMNGAAKVAMEEYGKKLAGMMEEADELKIRTVPVLVLEILAPWQAVELLAAGKQLHLSIHAWGRMRDRKRGGQQGQYLAVCSTV